MSKRRVEPSKGGSTGKRSSSRITVLSRAMKVVDAETRKEVRDKRIQQLESDNYVEEQDAHNDDDAYVDSEVST